MLLYIFLSYLFTYFLLIFLGKNKEMNSSYSSKAFIIGHPQEDAIQVITHVQIRFYIGDVPYTNYVIHNIIAMMSYHEWHIWLPLGAYGTYFFIYPLDMYLYDCQFILMFKTTLEKVALQITVNFKHDTGKVSAYSMASLFSTVSLFHLKEQVVTLG